MKCECVARVEKELAAKFAKDLNIDVEQVTAECQSAGFTVQDNTLKGYRRGKTVPMIAAFCPFCGSPTGVKKES
jgi:hypothetical protein